MSNTIRPTHQPGWNPTHPRWTHGPMTQKFQERDKKGGLGKNGGKHHKFMNGIGNSRYNLAQKIEALRAKEALE